MYNGSKGERFVWVVLAFLTIRALVPSDWWYRPYSDVKVLEVTQIGDSYGVVASFDKTNCAFVRLEVFGKTLGVWQFVDWEDNQGLGKNYDRSEGEQVLSILINPKGVSYDELQIRTRHACDTNVVDKVFTTISLGDE